MAQVDTWIDISAAVSCAEGCPVQTDRLLWWTPKEPHGPCSALTLTRWLQGQAIKNLFKRVWSLSSASVITPWEHSALQGLGVSITPWGIMQPLKPARNVFSPFKIPSCRFFWLIVPDNLNLVSGFGGIESLGEMSSNSELASRSRDFCSSSLSKLISIIHHSKYAFEHLFEF